MIYCYRINLFSAIYPVLIKFFMDLLTRFLIFATYTAFSCALSYILHIHQGYNYLQPAEPAGCID